MKKLFGLRIFVLLLCIVLTVAVFASCDSSDGGGTSDSSSAEGNGGETTGGDPSILKIPMSDTVILTPASADEATNEAVQILVGALKQYTGADATVKTDAELENAETTEILIGATNRAQSASALEKLNGQNGFVVLKDGNKIVLNATHAVMLDDAVNYFVNNCVSSSSSGTLQLPADLSFAYGSTGGVTLLGEDNACQYKVLFSQNVDTKGSASDLEEGEIDTSTGIDYIYKYVGMFNTEFSAKIGMSIEAEADKSTAEDGNLEILIGATNRPETKTFLKTLKPNEYGYGVVGNKLVIAGWGDYTSAMAVEFFLENCDAYLVDTEGDLKNLVMVEGERKTSAYTRWNVDIPFYQGGELMGVIDMVKYGYYLTYENATAEGYRAYLSQLEAAGFKFLQDNRIGDNLYATYYNSKVSIHAYYLSSDNTVRLAVDSLQFSELPPVEDTSPYYGEKVTDVSFTMHDFDTSIGNWGNCFIVTLEDGSFIVHDGGANDGSVEDEEIWKLLNHLNKRKDGKIVIAAYILSHGHSDHHDGFDALISKYGKDIILERIIHGEPGTTQNYRFYQNGHYATGSLETLAFKMQAPVHKAHSGQIFRIRNLDIEIVFSVETSYPTPPNAYNATSLITRFTAGEGENAQTLMILGDAQYSEAPRLVEIYGDELKCDILQVAHHGWGGSVDLYAHCAPSVVVWPGTYSTVDSQMKPTNNNGWAVINRSLCNQENVLLVVVADRGHKTIKIPLIGLTENEEENERLLVEVVERFDGKT